jgi:hypothetical protein
VRPYHFAARIVPRTGSGNPRQICVTGIRSVILSALADRDAKQPAIAIVAVPLFVATPEEGSRTRICLIAVHGPLSSVAQRRASPAEVFYDCRHIANRQDFF